MRINLLTLSLLIIFTKCSSQGFDTDKIKKELGETNNQFNDSIEKWEAQYKSLSNQSIDSPIQVLNKIEREISSYSIEKNRIKDLLFLKGNIYYQIDSFERAAETFSLIDTSNKSPKYLVARAGAYTKLNQYPNALNDLVKASTINPSYKWNLGNFYEITRKKDSAIMNYQDLYQTDTITYKYCLERITELSKQRPLFLTELVFKDRERISVHFY